MKTVLFKGGFAGLAFLFLFGGMVSGAQAQATTTATSTSTLSPGRSQVIVYTNVINDNVGGAQPASAAIAVTGTNVSDPQFQGSLTGTVVELDAGNYSVTPSALGGYTSTLSQGCSGLIPPQATRVCVITYDDVGVAQPPADVDDGTLTCSPARQSVRVNEIISFTATGGTGTYTWSTAQGSFQNRGAAFSITESTPGTKTIIVTSGGEQAVCVVDVLSASASTSTPGFPNTGGVGVNPIWYVFGALFLSFLLFAGYMRFRNE